MDCQQLCPWRCTSEGEFGWPSPARCSRRSEREVWLLGCFSAETCLKRSAGALAPQDKEIVFKPLPSFFSEAATDLLGFRLQLLRRTLHNGPEVQKSSPVYATQDMRASSKIVRVVTCSRSANPAPNLDCAFELLFSSAEAFNRTVVELGPSQRVTLLSRTA